MMQKQQLAHRHHEEFTLAIMPVGSYPLFSYQRTYKIKKNRKHSKAIHNRARTQGFMWFGNVPTSTGKCSSSSSH